MKDKHESPLDHLYLAAPCPMTWESMEGDDKVRNCGGCSKNVYNISAMSQREAEDFLRVNGDSECMQFYRRADGTIMTDNCPVGLRKLRDKVKAVAKVAAGFVAFVVSLPVAFAQGASKGSGTASDTSSGTKNGNSTVKSNINSTNTNAIPANATPANVAPHPVLGGKPMMHVPTPGRVMYVPPANNGGINNNSGQPTNGTQTPTGHSTVKNNGANGSGKDGSKDGGKDRIKLQAEMTTLAKTEAVEFYKKAKAAEEKNKTQLAEFFYEKALDAVDKQGNCDPKFRCLIEGELGKIRKTPKVP